MSSFAGTWSVEALAGLDEPIRQEDGVDSGDDGTGQAGHELLPLQAALDVLGRVVRPRDQVLRAHEPDPPVDDDELAVVAQVGALVLALEGLHGQHPRPLHADAIELRERLLAAGDLRRGQVIGEQAHRDTASDRPLHRGEEAARGVIPRHDEELHVHERLSPCRSPRPSRRSTPGSRRAGSPDCRTTAGMPVSFSFCCTTRWNQRGQVTSIVSRPSSRTFSRMISSIRACSSRRFFGSLKVPISR